MGVVVRAMTVAGKTSIPTAALAMVLALAGRPAPAAGAGGLAVSHPWSRPAAAGGNAIGYMTISNRGRRPDVLVGGRAPIAQAVQIHRSGMAGGIMRMDRQDRVPIPAGATVAFGPQGYHLMLLGIARTTRAGDRIPVTLEFASGTRLRVVFEVETGLSAPAPSPVRRMDPDARHMGH